MAAVLETNPFRLTPVAEGRGVSCDVRGCFVGKEPLLTRSPDTSGREFWAPRPQAELEDVLSARYGHPIDMSAKVDGLAGIADAQLAAIEKRLPRLTVKLVDVAAVKPVAANASSMTSLTFATACLFTA